MGVLETMKVTLKDDPDHGVIVINKSDFDEGLHSTPRTQLELSNEPDSDPDDDDDDDDD